MYLDGALFYYDLRNGGSALLFVTEAEKSDSHLLQFMVWESKIGFLKQNQHIWLLWLHGELKYFDLLPVISI